MKEEKKESHMDRVVRLFINLMIAASIINAIWLMFNGCTIKVKPMHKFEGPGIEIVITEKDIDRHPNLDDLYID